MLKLTKNQKRIADLMNQLPDDMEQEELEALICSVTAWYFGEEDVPGFLMYLSIKVGKIFERIAKEAEKETKH
jgi:hypothetical protein